TPLSPGDFIGKWISLIAPAAADIGPRAETENLENFINRLEQASVVRSLQNLMAFPFVRTRVAAGTLALHGGYFGVATGELHVYDAARKTFAPLALQLSSA
ncbi:MAG TPA: carbonic anhydrase, partial [Xanthobacteraceae bacterium]|nr:carbonic anhydrase [Xanthobacteraceae bacterium]